MNNFAAHVEITEKIAEMHTLKAHFIPFVLIFSGFLVLSCENEDCVSVHTNNFLVEFWKADSSATRKIAFYSIKAENNDSVFYNLDSARSLYSLPVNPAANATTFIFTEIDTIIRDTVSYEPLDVKADTSFSSKLIELSYQKGERIISVDCGVEIAYSKVNVEKCDFPNYVLEKTDLSRFNHDNIKIYY